MIYDMLVKILLIGFRENNKKNLGRVTIPKPEGIREDTSLKKLWKKAAWTAQPNKISNLCRMI